MTAPRPSAFVSRGGEKLTAAIDHFALDVRGMICADLGAHVGGFTDCLLQRNAERVYAVDTSYGTFAWKLRRDPRVVTLERTNALHVALPEPVSLVVIDVGWTPQAKILPIAARLLVPGGRVITLIKPHYEAERHELMGGVLPDALIPGVVANVLDGARADGWDVVGTVDSPIRGHGGNREVLAYLSLASPE